MCRRIRARYKCKSSFAEASLPDMLGWGNNCGDGMDFTERLHTLMRSDICSDTVGKRFTPSADRVFCYQVRIEHEARKGNAVCNESTLSDTVKDYGKAAGSAPGVSKASVP